MLSLTCDRKSLSNGFKDMSLSSMTELQDRFQQLEMKCAKLEQEKKDNSNPIDELRERGSGDGAREQIRGLAGGTDKGK